MIGERGKGRLPHFRDLYDWVSPFVRHVGVEMASVVVVDGLLLYSLCGHGRRGIGALFMMRRLFIPSRMCVVVNACGICRQLEFRVLSAQFLVTNKERASCIFFGPPLCLCH
jgi:hypothetical protein